MTNEELALGILKKCLAMEYVYLNDRWVTFDGSISLTEDEVALLRELRSEVDE